MKTLIISETATSTWHYHLREVVNGKRYYGGGKVPPALCGAKLGWDTLVPLDAYGVKDHLPTKWCAKCETIRKELTK